MVLGLAFRGVFVRACSQVWAVKRPDRFRIAVKRQPQGSAHDWITYVFLDQVVVFQHASHSDQYGLADNRPANDWLMQLIEDMQEKP